MPAIVASYAFNPTAGLTAFWARPFNDNYEGYDSTGKSVGSASYHDNMAASDPHYLLKARETEAVAFISELYVRASLERKETRAGHFREDYPRRDENCPAWLCLRKGKDGVPEFFTERVPLETYSLPVTRYYQDNFRFAGNTDD